MNTATIKGKNFLEASYSLVFDKKRLPSIKDNLLKMNQQNMNTEESRYQVKSSFYSLKGAGEPHYRTTTPSQQIISKQRVLWRQWEEQPLTFF